MKILKIPRGHWHLFRCEICYDMAQHGYRQEEDYWSDFFAEKLKPIKYKLVKEKKK